MDQDEFFLNNLFPYHRTKEYQLKQLMFTFKLNKHVILTYFLKYDHFLIEDHETNGVPALNLRLMRRVSYIIKNLKKIKFRIEVILNDPKRC